MNSVLADRYRLERQLGKGGMGSVWLAEHLALRSWVAVKLMDPAIAATPEGVERFRREAQAAATLRSAHVVQVLDYGVHQTTPYLVMELLQGESLAGCLEREKRLSPERTVAVMTQVARALGRAHAADIVHRDLKPDNIFLVREDDQELVKILDFGIAKTPQAQFGGMETRTGVTMGTPYYMSPEQVEGKKAVDFRTDLWAMAVIASECMTGVRPFDGSTFGELLLNICARPIPPPSSQGLHLPGFDEWFAKATSREPSQRFASAQELASSLRDVVSGAAGPHAFAPAVVGVVPTSLMNATGATASPSALNTSQAVESTRSRNANALPWLLVGVLLLGAVTTTLLLTRSKSSDALAEPSAVANREDAAPAAKASDNAPAPELQPSAVAVTATKAPPARHTTLPEVPKPSAQPLAAATNTASPATPNSVPAGKPSAASLTCFSDPFSGQIRPMSAAHVANVTPFGCKQDPFTGRYKKL